MGAIFKRNTIETEKNSGNVDHLEYEQAVFAETSHFVLTTGLILKGNRFMYRKRKIPTEKRPSNFLRPQP